MKKILFMLVLCAAIGAASPATHAAAEVQVTVTFAVGGAACGFYLFFAYSSGFTPLQNTVIDSPALLNYDSEGWKVRPPLLQFAGDTIKNPLPYAELVRIRF